MLADQLPKIVSYPMMKVPVLLRASFVIVLCLAFQLLQANKVLDKSSLEALQTIVNDIDDEHVAKYIDAFLRHPETTEELLTRGQRYFPLIEKELTVQGLPDALKVLPLIESRFDPMAISRVGAAGLWQFMAATARELGLRIDAYVDERRDPAKATRAALSYLNYLYTKYNDWSLAFAAYNSGPGRVNRAIKLAGGESSFAAIKAFLPEETRQYIPKYIAAQYIIQYHKDLGLKPAYPELDLVWTGTVLLNREMSITKIAELVNVPTDLIIDLNPSLKRQYVPKLSQGFDLVLPKRVTPTFQYFLDTDEAPGPSFAYRTMEIMIDKKVTVFEIAGLLKLDPYLLKSWNQLTEDVIEPGVQLIIHELYDPSQMLTQTISPKPFIKEKSNLQPLAPAIDYRQNLLRLIDRQRTRTEETINWNLHQINIGYYKGIGPGRIPGLSTKP
ncbi:MAG: transglycosylase SLT domain-containing protein [Saprospiraceae bacterium]|nr:transglycosylase SLT domain-containing protein [Saprospiraceae bacterium]